MPLHTPVDISDGLSSLQGALNTAYILRPLALGFAPLILGRGWSGGSCNPSVRQFEEYREYLGNRGEYF